MLNIYNPQFACFALNFAKIGIDGFKDRWHVYTLYTVQLICTIFCCFYRHIVHVLLLPTGIAKKTHKFINTSNNSFFQE